MKKIGLIILIVGLILAALLFIRFVIGGDEDGWICVKGEWVKHGNPLKPMPSNICPK